MGNSFSIPYYDNSLPSWGTTPTFTPDTQTSSSNSSIISTKQRDGESLSDYLKRLWKVSEEKAKQKAELDAQIKEIQKEQEANNKVLEESANAKESADGSLKREETEEDREETEKAAEKAGKITCELTGTETWMQN